ncbi:MAG TPA: hypothetical protein PK228_03365 [Saprospiraceae bacterium]|nr:hypothetical protein [Saprospiraceae bacterium]
MRNIFSLLAIIGAVLPAAAQRLDHTDLLLFSMQKTADSMWQATAPRFLTAFNPHGYNNQPAFFSNNELYLTVQMAGDTTQTDIYALDVWVKTQTRITATPATAEYSPTLMPGGRRFSAVRVEEDGNQRLWSFPLDRSDNGRPEFPGILNVGYHCWLRDTLAALFIVGDDGAMHTLGTAGTRGQNFQRIASNVGRCLQTLPDGRLAFVTKTTDKTWFLKTWNPQKPIPEIVVIMLPGSEDFALLPDGTYISGSKSKLYQFKPGRNTDWKEIADLSKYGVKNITRLAASKDGKLAVVVN